MMCFDGHALPRKAQPIYCCAHLRRALSQAWVITYAFIFLTLTSVDKLTFTSVFLQLAKNVSHEVQYLQVVTVSVYILYLQTLDGSHLLYPRHFEVWQAFRKTRQASALGSALSRLWTVSGPLRHGACLRGSRSGPFFTRRHVVGVNQNAH